MKGSIPILLVCSISFLVGCSSTPTKTVLEERAGYGVNGPPLGSVGASGGVRYVPTRVPERVVVPWLHAHELPSKDYFWGAWLSVIVEPESWAMVKVDVPKVEKAKGKRTEDKPGAKPPKKPKAAVKPAA